MCSVVADHAPGPAGGARGIRDVQRVGDPDGDAVAWLGSGHRLLPMQVTVGDQGCRCLRALQDDAAPWLWLHSPIARSRMGLYSTTRPTSTPQEADITTLAAARLMRSASSRAAKAAGHHRVDGADARSGEHSDFLSGIIGKWMITRRRARDTVMETRERRAGGRCRTVRYGPLTSAA
jgi:hypothetical protein